MNEEDAYLHRAHSALEKTWRHLRTTFIQGVMDGESIEAFPDLSEDEARRAAHRARALLAQIDSTHLNALPHQLAVTLEVARFQLGIEAQTRDNYWLAQTYGGFPALFPVGPYGGGSLLRYAVQSFRNFVLVRSDDADRYLALIKDYARLIGQTQRKLEEQAALGIRIPRPALAGMRKTVIGHGATAQEALRVNPDRLATVRAPATFSQRVTRQIEEHVAPAFAALLESLGEGYARKAPENVGMAQFKEGADVYERLVAQHLTIPMTIEAVHRTGHERLDRLEQEMTQIRTDLGYPDRTDFHRHLLSDPALTASSDVDAQTRFDTAIQRIEPRIAQLFHFKPRARYRAARLDAHLEAGMTYGYYQRPAAGHADGVYYYNASNLAEGTLATAASLIYHELIPGHHFHIATQIENELLHPLQQQLSFTAFTEGWAEYAATLAGEIGMYADPHEHYGRLLMDAFLTCRLVVDTGMNALGWSLERARHYLRDHTILSEAEIHSETLRYSTDIPAQSLAYKIGEIRIHELRDRARAVLGSRFDLRDFHDAVLRSGGMPLRILDWHVDSWIAAQPQRKP